MKHAYSRQFDPPAPVLAVGVRVPNAAAGAQLSGKVDTGADLCAVPQALVDELELPPGRVVRAAGFAGVPTEVPVYRLDLEIEGHRFAGVEALATQRRYFLIGRNVLRHFIVELDGPRETFRLRAGRRRRA